MNVMLALAKTTHVHALVDFYYRNMFCASVSLGGSTTRNPSYGAWMNNGELSDFGEEDLVDHATSRQLMGKTDRVGCFTKELWL